MRYKTAAFTIIFAVSLSWSFADSSGQIQEKNISSSKIAEVKKVFAEKSAGHDKESFTVKSLTKDIAALEKLHKDGKYDKSVKEADFLLQKLSHMNPVLKAMPDKPGKKGLYLKNLTGKWTEEAGGNTLEYIFTKSSFSYKMGNRSSKVRIVKRLDTRGMFILKINKYYVPIWWELIDSNTVRMSKMVGGAKYTSLKAAMKAEARVMSQLIKRK